MLAGSSPSSRLACLMLLACLSWLAGCAGIRVRRSEGPTVTSALRASAVTGNDLSPRTRQTVRRHDFEALYPGNLRELTAKLHDEALRDPRPDLLFALSEIYFIRAGQSEKKHDPDAYIYYYLSAGYAYHYLFDDYPPRTRGEPRRISEPHLDDRAPVPPAEAFDPRFRVACDLYNAGLAKCIAAAQQCQKLDPRHRLVLPARETRDAVTLRVLHEGFRFQPAEFGPVQLCSDFQVSGLANHHRTYGLGVPLVGSRDPAAPRAAAAYHPPGVNFPVTAFFRFEGSLIDLRERRAGRLEFINPLTTQTVKVRGRVVPLESDLTTPLAYYLASTRLEGAGYTGFLCPDSLGARAGLHTLEPYQPGRIPVILVHGLLGSPLTWAPMYNDLQADPVLRSRFQFWVYFYPTGKPYLLTAADLREQLARMRQTLDPQGKDPALSDMVLVGHSMGGLVSRLLTVDGGEDFWNLVSSAPLDSLKLEPENRNELRNTFFFQRQPHVTRAIFLGTPHRGSKVSPSILGRIGSRLAGLPVEVMKTARDVLEDNPQAVASMRGNPLTTSIDLLDPHAPALQLISHRPRPTAVQYHSVIGVTSSRVLLLERLFGGGYCQPSDGVVPFASAHLEDVASELVVPADHYHVHHHPLAILEVRRVLMEHLRDHDQRGQTIQRVKGESAP